MTETVKLPWRMDLSTMALIAGGFVTIGGGLIAGGYTLSEIQSDTNRNTIAVSDLSVRIERNDSKTDLNEVRIESLEKIATDALILRRELEGTVNDFRSDIAVIKEILERMDKDKRP